MCFDVVVSVDLEGGIGRGGTIPWEIPEDLTRFRDLTRSVQEENKRNVVIMGRKTWESLPFRFRPLPQRFNLVLSRAHDVCLPGAFICKSLEEALDFSQKGDFERVFIIGGSTLYKEALGHPECIRVYLTRIRKTFSCDVFFPEIPEEFVLEVGGEIKRYKGTEYNFETYVRRGIQSES